MSGSTIDYLRSFRLFGTPVFDWVMTAVGAIGVLYLAQYLLRFARVVVEITLLNYLIVLFGLLLLAIPLHSIFGIKTIYL
jgi:hypothetical protein